MSKDSQSKLFSTFQTFEKFETNRTGKREGLGLFSPLSLIHRDKQSLRTLDPSLLDQTFTSTTTLTEHVYVNTLDNNVKVEHASVVTPSTSTDR